MTGLNTKSFWFLIGILFGCVLMLLVICGATYLGHQKAIQPKVALGISI